MTHHLGEEGVDTADSCAAVQRDVKRVETWADRNFMRFSQGKCKNLFTHSPAVGEEEPHASLQAGANGLQNSFAAEDVGPGGHHEAAPRPCSNGIQQHPGLH